MREGAAGYKVVKDTTGRKRSTRLQYQYTGNFSSTARDHNLSPPITSTTFLPPSTSPPTSWLVCLNASAASWESLPNLQTTYTSPDGAIDVRAEEGLARSSVMGMSIRRARSSDKERRQDEGIRTGRAFD